MTETVANVAAGETPRPAPTKPDGTGYRYEMIFDAGRTRGYADGAEELCGLLIPGYEHIDVDDPRSAAEARIGYALRCQVRLQALLAAETDLGDCTSAEQQILMAGRHTPPTVEVWEAPVPLVLVTTFYVPVGDLSRPVGRPRGDGTDDSNLIWLDPTDELSLVTSLHTAGLLSLHVADHGRADGGVLEDG